MGVRGSARGRVAVVGVVLVGWLGGCGAQPTPLPDVVSATPSPTVSAAAPSAGGEPTYADDRYDSLEGVTRPLAVWTPAGAESRLPTIVLVHGGGFTGGDNSEWAEIGPEIARRGYTTIAVANWLVTPGYPRQVDDLVTALEQIRGRADELHVDPDKMALLGSSAGANLSLLAVTAKQAPVRAVVGWSGLYDFTRPGVDRLGSVVTYLGCDPEADASCRDGTATQASPALRVREGQPPIRIVNAAEESMPLEQLDVTTAALEAKGQPVTRVELAGGEHATAYAETELQPTLDWLAPHLD